MIVKIVSQTMYTADEFVKIETFCYVCVTVRIKFSRIHAGQSSENFS